MKKIYFLFISVFMCSLVHAQPFTSLWTKLANATDYAWFTTDNNVTSLDYNPATDKLLVSKRNDRVFIINAATGAEEGQLNLTGLGTESFKHNKIRVTSDGVIYGISLVTGAGQCKIYRWANQTAAPALVADFAVTERCGDAFGLAGTGNNTVLYASGSGTTSNAFNIYILTTNNAGANFFVDSKVTMTSSPTAGQQWANRTVEPAGVGANSNIWIKGGGFSARKISVGPNNSGVRTGTVVTTIPDGVSSGQASPGYGGMRLLVTSNGNRFLAFGGGNNNYANSKLTVLNINDETNPSTYGTDSLTTQAAAASNGNGSGDVAYKLNADNTYTFFYLGTNNAVGATKSTSSILPIELTRFSATTNNKTVSVTWTTASEFNSNGFEIEKSLNGIDFSSIGFVKTKAAQGISSQQINYGFEDSKLTGGKAYYRLKQVDLDGKFSYSGIASVLIGMTKNFSVSSVTNPVKDRIVLIVNASTQRVLQVQITNASGSIVISKQYSVQAGNSTLDIPTNNLSAGLLNVVVKDQESQQVIRVVKQ